MITGRILEIDEWNRIHIQFPENKDTNNTRLCLEAFGKKFTQGYNPLKKTYFLGKLSKDVFAYHKGTKIQDLKTFVGYTANFEVQLLPFSGTGKGWYIKIKSINIL